jgi:hypothetical protein
MNTRSISRKNTCGSVCTKGNQYMAQGDYITNVGERLIDLLTDISLSDEAKQKVADTMRLPVPQVTAILDRLLDKIDNDQVTAAELALIMAAPVADEE